SDRRGRGRSEIEGACRARHRSAAPPVPVVRVRVARPNPPGRRSRFRKSPDRSADARRSRVAPPRYQPGRRTGPRRETYVPTPLKVIRWVPALSVMVTPPERAPVAGGRKVTVMVQLAPEARVLPQPLFMR